jgi:hypothetical protein
MPIDNIQEEKLRLLEASDYKYSPEFNAFVHYAHYGDFYVRQSIPAQRVAYLTVNGIQNTMEYHRYEADYMYEQEKARRLQP